MNRSHEEYVVQTMFIEGYIKKKALIIITKIHFFYVFLTLK